MLASSHSSLSKAWNKYHRIRGSQDTSIPRFLKLSPPSLISPTEQTSQSFPQEMHPPPGCNPVPSTISTSMFPVTGKGKSLLYVYCLAVIAP
ncbi:hypothetical protein TNCT_164511 [Trichonephila clavata]|uniref:Uncharacterized protein n=1 Tax=Trichonephila clavata TaxID=2740835 RepID=A0A8X6EZA2_TRICU|nr:hypothetical protein TNCT_164511 [Trichonephila clavata]